MRARLIDGILKICSLGDNFGHLHKLHASDSMWSTAHQMLDACPSQSALLHTDMSTGWSAHSNILDPQQADTTKPTWMRALKQSRLSFSSMVSVPLKNLTICFLLDQMQALKSKPEIASLGLKIQLPQGSKPHHPVCRDNQGVEFITSTE